MTTTLADVPFTPVEESLTRLERAVSPHVGIVTRTVSSTCTTDEARLPNCAGELASAHRTIGAPTVEFGSGAHPSPSRARAAALGEAIERYSAMFVPFEQLVVTTARTLASAAVHPSRFALFHETQHAQPGFPFAPFTEETPTTFVEGLALSDGGPAYLPAELVYLRRPGSTTRPIGYSTSSGLACAPTLVEAILAALLEIVERDAVMLVWKCGLSLPLLDWSGHVTLGALDGRFFRSTGVRFDVLDASVFLDVPIAIAAVHGPRGSRAALAVGAGAAADIGEAWLKAVSESFGVYRWLGRQAASLPERPPPEPDSITSFDEHMLFYSRDEEAALASFLVASPERRPVAGVPPLEGRSPRSHVESILARLAKRGSSAYAVDVTPPDVRTLGLRGARVIVPELCALDVSHRCRFLGGPRLYRAAHEAGLLPAPLDVADLNVLPHPFP